MTEREREFAFVSVRQKGMVQIVWGENVYLGYPEVVTDILIVGVDNDLGVSGWVCPIFVRPWVQRCHVDVFDLFVFASNVM